MSQSIRIVVRQIGNPDVAADIYSAQDTSDYIEFQYGAKGYMLKDSHYLGEVVVRGADGQPTGVGGWKVMFILTKNEEGKKVKKDA